jgi:uncharacterized membrane protein YvlD (DUF360 family)
MILFGFFTDVFDTLFVVLITDLVTGAFLVTFFEAAFLEAVTLTLLLLDFAFFVVVFETRLFRC